ncbi:MAG: hypothetical protein V3W04_06540 [Gammaproteobacteria bacterium]
MLVKFTRQDVEKIYQHTLSNPVMWPHAEQQYILEYAKEGATPVKDKDGCMFLRENDIDLSLLPKRFLLAKMNASVTIEVATRNLIGAPGAIYAEGFGPTDINSGFDADDIFGNEDFERTLPIAWIELFLSGHHHLFCILVDDSGLSWQAEDH